MSDAPRFEVRSGRHGSESVNRFSRWQERGLRRHLRGMFERHPSHVEILPFSSNEVDVIVGLGVSQGLEEVVAAGPPKVSVEAPRLVDSPTRLPWTKPVLLFALVVLLGSVATISVMWLMRG